MEALIIGYGSIGQRHERVLTSLRHNVSIVTSQQTAQSPIYADLETAINSKHFDYVIISNQTNLHYPTIKQLIALNYQGLVLVEKPIFAEYVPNLAHQFKGLYVGYNLRFHPLLQTLKQQLENKTIIAASIYTGQYLPLWRTTDYRKNYSVNKSEGGGVLNDLSHELDYATWLFGSIKELCAYGGKFSDLTVDSEEIYTILMASEHVSLITLQLNYYDRCPKREIIVHTSNASYHANLISNTLSINGTISTLDHERDTSYRQQHQAIIRGETTHLCDYKQASYILQLISTTEKSNQQKQWVKL